MKNSLKWEPHQILRISFFGVIFIAISALSVWYTRSHDVVFGSGAFYYQIHPFLPWWRPSLGNLLVVFSAFVSVLLVRASLQKIYPHEPGKELAIWAAALSFAGAPLFYTELFSVPAFLLLLVGIPFFVLTFLHSLESKVALVGMIIGVSMAVILMPQFAMIIAILLLTSIPWLRSQKHKGRSRVVIAPLAAALFGTVIAALLPWASQLLTIRYPRSAHSVDIHWILDFPLSAWLSGYFSLNPFETPPGTLPAFALVLVVCLLAWAVSKKVLPQKGVLLWALGCLLAGTILALGPVLKQGGEVVQPLIPLPGSLMLLPKDLENIPWYCIPLALWGAALFLFVLLEGQKNKFQQAAFVAMGVVLAQYMLFPVPGTAVYHPTGYGQLQDHTSGAVLELFDQSTFQKYHQRERHRLHGREILSDSELEGQVVFDQIIASGNTLIPQNTPDHYAAVLDYYDIAAIDLFTEAVVPFKSKPRQLLATESSQFSKQERMRQRGVVEKHLRLETLFENASHVLYQVEPPQDEIDAVLTIPTLKDRATACDAWTARSSAPKLCKRIKLANGAGLHYYNFRTEDRDLHLSMEIGSPRYLDVRILVDGVAVHEASFASGTKKQVVELEIPDRTPGLHQITFEIRKASGALLTSVTRPAGLTISQIDYRSTP